MSSKSYLLEKNGVKNIVKTEYVYNYFRRLAQGSRFRQRLKIKKRKTAQQFCKSGDNLRAMSNKKRNPLETVFEKKKYLPQIQQNLKPMENFFSTYR